MPGAVEAANGNATNVVAKETTTGPRAPSPTPNSGRTIPDLNAYHENEPQKQWRLKSQVDPSKHIRIAKLAHMRYSHPDLDVITTFMKDFGAHVVKRTDDKVWFRGYGPDQYVYYAEKGPKKFLGATFAVESYAELEKASKLEGASQIKELDDAPGKGHIISLRDPDGFPLNLMHGQAPASVGEQPETIVLNFETNKPRKRQFNRFQPGPAAIHKLGHFGFCTTKLEELISWYTKTFNIIPTDFLYVGEGAERRIVAMFAHIDQGQDLVDHHSFFMTSNATSHVHHCSFEVHDFDTQALGHQWLEAKGYELAWGVGRHVLGSQIFDYWWDTSKNMVEHYIDGDMVNEDTPIGYAEAGDESLSVWGPEVPKGFLE